MLTTNDIRRRFLAFFQKHQHEVVRSSSLVPKNDPSLLFTNSGMVQFKGIFQGLEKRHYSRATTAQKCLRVGGKHNDLENVGRTARHHTFFEMLGNFSFGDYFKEQAIQFAWEFITKELKLPEDRLYATVYEDDDEAIDLWLKNTTIPAERILRMGEKDNFWSMGDTGPCGPCSEILIDQGEHMTCGPNCGIGKCDCDRFLEIWNLVFMQFNQIAPGQREPLPRPSIDTGMGLERVAAVCQGVHSNYDTDLFTHIIEHACSLANVTYCKSAPNTNDTDTALRVIADHSRSMAFMIADGIMPSNEGRGYILRRLIRRAYRFGRLIGMPAAFLYQTANHVVSLMGEDFPELVASREFMQRVIREEEERFEKTLENGLTLLEDAMQQLRNSQKNAIPGDVAFKLYDTYGFPLDIIHDVAEKQGFVVDENSFNEHMAEQKKRAKAAWKGSGEKDITSRFAALLEEGVQSHFSGYETLTENARVTALMNADGERVSELTHNQKGYLVTGSTPFYGTSGGQLGDTGTITTATGQALVTETLKPSATLTVHHITVSEGTIALDAETTLTVNADKRLATARNHTCAHLLHAALQEVLGSHARQAGSLVTPERLRFDFNHISAMTPEELILVEQKVNAAILANIPLTACERSYDEAIKGGVIALFGEKYGDTVRVIGVEGVSQELCGGTHLNNTGQAGMFMILSEVGIAAGVRRIEAVTGWNTIATVNTQRTELTDACSLLKSRPGELAQKITELQNDLKAARKDIEKMATLSATGQSKSLVEKAETINGIRVIAAASGVSSLKALRELMDDMRSKVASGIICLTMIEETGKVQMLVAVSKDLHSRFNASDLAKELAPIIGGSGGGRPDMAQAGGTDSEKIDSMFASLKKRIAG